MLTGSGCLGHHPADNQIHHRHTPVFVVESIPHIELVAQYPVGPVVDPVPGKPKIPVGVRWIRRGARVFETDLHGEYGWTGRRISRTLRHFIIIIIIIIDNYGWSHKLHWSKQIYHISHAQTVEFYWHTKLMVVFTGAESHWEWSPVQRDQHTVKAFVAQHEDCQDAKGSQESTERNMVPD